MTDENMTHRTHELLAREIDSDRRKERMLIPKALIALAIVAVLVFIREVFFV